MTSLRLILSFFLIVSVNAFYNYETHDPNKLEKLNDLRSRMSDLQTNSFQGRRVLNKQRGVDGRVYRAASTLDAMKKGDGFCAHVGIKKLMHIFKLKVENEEDDEEDDEGFEF